MGRIQEKFEELRKKNRKAFIVFITAGYPNLKITEKLILELSLRGVDILELGIPFSDPLADGPVIQESSGYALRNKVNLIDIFNLVKRVRKKTSLPICLMTYYNPIFCFGEERFVKLAKKSGVDGLIVADLPIEESFSLLKIAKIYDLDIIFFISPTTSLERAKLICKLSRGFIYYISLTGVTGPREELPKDLLENLKKIKKITSKPICVGFGISNRAQLQKINEVADGVILGSIVIKKIKENLKRADLIMRVGEFISSLKS